MPLFSTQPDLERFHRDALMMDLRNEKLRRDAARRQAGYDLPMDQFLQMQGARSFPGLLAQTHPQEILSAAAGSVNPAFFGATKAIVPGFVGGLAFQGGRRFANRTPEHPFGLFDEAFIGTGEGSAWRGYGFYFGEAEGTGRFYKHVVERDNPSLVYFGENTFNQELNNFGEKYLNRPGATLSRLSPSQARKVSKEDRAKYIVMAMMDTELDLLDIDAVHTLDDIINNTGLEITDIAKQLNRIPRGSTNTMQWLATNQDFLTIDPEVLGNLELMLSNVPSEWINAQDFSNAAMWLRRNKDNIHQIPNIDTTIRKVDVPDPLIDRMITWEKPLDVDSLPEHLQDFWNAIVARAEGGGLFRASTLQIQNPTGGTFYETLSEFFGGGREGKRQASKLLAEEGIPGIKYLDQLSRGDDVGPQGRTRNFVVFPDFINEVKILEELD